jgi:apolipoprotein D and lipocalin family protein
VKTILLILIMTLPLMSCARKEYSKTVEHLEVDSFMKKWFVIAGRFTFMENGAHNAVEEYVFNEKKNRIDINFYFNKDSFNGSVKKIPQKAWVVNEKTNAHWLVSPFWPIKFDYLVIALAEDYSWTAIGVPSEKYLWIMADRWDINDEELDEMIKTIKASGYSVENISRLPQKW